MRKITSDAVEAFNCMMPFKRDNTRVAADDSSTRLYLHGNLIAHYTDRDGLFITCAGWGTPTTKERLNGLLHELDAYTSNGVYTRKGQLYYDDEPIAADQWIKVELP